MMMMMILRILKSSNKNLTISKSLRNGQPCEYFFSLGEWQRYSQIASYYCEVTIDGIEEEIDANETETGEERLC